MHQEKNWNVKYAVISAEDHTFNELFQEIVLKMSFFDKFNKDNG